MGQNDTNSTDEDDYKSLCMYYVPMLVILCLISIVINIKVLLTINWLRRPISPTLHISLSLAAADAFSSTFVGIGLIINNYISQVFDVIFPCYIPITTEMYRLSGFIITVVHLLALSMNHWLGIVKPLHYSSIMTTRKITVIITFLWVLPIALFNIYFFSASDKDFWQTGCTKDDTFLHHFKFRMIFSLLFFIPIFLMTCFYSHILIIVKQQQKVWANLSRSGSKRTKNVTKAKSQQRRNLEGNIKAVFTTLLILGSCMIGWMPAILKFILICKDKCIYSVADAENISTTMNFFISYTTHVLLILKTLANPIIYSARMHEIKDATRRMNTAIAGKLCKFRRGDTNLFDTQSYQLGCSGSMGAATLYKLNGSTIRRSINRTHASTLV